MQLNVIEYFENGALRHCPDKVAIVDEARRTTFYELEQAAKAFAAKIIAKTISINRPIAVFLPKGTETLVADLGIIYSGNCYANLDVKSPSQRLQSILGNLQADLIVTSRALAESLRVLGIAEHSLLLIDASPATGIDFDPLAIRKRLESVIDTDPLCIIHTSGSTGIPKGVALNHRGIIDFMDWVFERFEFDGSQIIGSLSPYYFDIYTLELFLCLGKGATLVIIPEQHAAFPAKLLEFLVQQSINFLFWVPTIMVNIANQDLFATHRPDCLKTVFFAGEVFPTKHLNYWRRHLNNALFVNLYGPIEICVDCTYFVVDREFADDEKLPIGIPCRNTDVFILTEENKPAKDGESGELCVRGSSLALGYWNNPDRTAQAFVQNPLNTHYPELIYRTGDVVLRNQRGEIMFLGRKDYQIKHLGYRIELGEIEAAVLRIADIRNACVVYSPEKKEIILFFEASETMSATHIREKLSSFVPKYMLPTVFKQMEQLPRNPNGKIDRKKLAVAGA